MERRSSRFPKLILITNSFWAPFVSRGDNMRHLAGKVLALAGAALLLAGTQHKAQANDDWFFDGDQSRILTGYKIAPVPLHLTRKSDVKMVGLGSYLVNAVGGCNDCHTNPSYAPGGNPFQGQKK